MSGQTTSEVFNEPVDPAPGEPVDNLQSLFPNFFTRILAPEEIRIRALRCCAETLVYNKIIDMIGSLPSLTTDCVQNMAQSIANMKKPDIALDIAIHKSAAMIAVARIRAQSAADSREHKKRRKTGPPKEFPPDFHKNLSRALRDVYGLEFDENLNSIDPEMSEPSKWTPEEGTTTRDNSPQHSNLTHGHSTPRDKDSSQRHSAVATDTMSNNSEVTQRESVSAPARSTVTDSLPNPESPQRKQSPPSQSDPHYNPYYDLPPLDEYSPRYHSLRHSGHSPNHGPSIGHTQRQGNALRRSPSRIDRTPPDDEDDTPQVARFKNQDDDPNHPTLTVHKDLPRLIPPPPARTPTATNTA